MSDEPMRYGLLGEDTGTPEDKLAKYTGEVDWSYLKPHYESGVLYFVDPSLALEEVGQALCRDQASTVESWLKSGDLVKIAPLHAQQWEEHPARFRALVVSPFVLCQPVPGH